MQSLCVDAWPPALWAWTPIENKNNSAPVLLLEFEKAGLAHFAILLETNNSRKWPLPISQAYSATCSLLPLVTGRTRTF